jgi:hypothetical protein
MTTSSKEIERVLDGGEFCYLAARTGLGPHLTPTVFVRSRGAVWVTTSRDSVKARAWRGDPVVAGLVRDTGGSVVFRGRVRAYDLLDAGTWERSLENAPAVTVASLRFTRKNARFFAGYAVDARHVPLAWTPPGRVFVEVPLERMALVRDGRVVDGWANGPGAAASKTSFRSVRTADALGALPGHLRRELGEDGAGALALDGDEGPVVLPARWRADDGRLNAVVAVDALALAGVGEAPKAALVMDRPSWWRARRMLGCMVQGDADVFVPARVGSGVRSLASAIARAGGDADRDALVRMRPARVVWWEGWTSASMAVA